MGAANANRTRLSALPFGIPHTFCKELYVRALLLNCVTVQYSSLWKSMWDSQFISCKWSIADSRLKPFAKLSQEWSHDTPLRNPYERRMALVEIDVISAMALGLSLIDLTIIYSVQFPIMQQYEDDTWYDAKGEIVFTSSSGLKGIGVDSRTWQRIHDQKEGETYTHTIDPAKSELYGGQQVTYYAPYTKCDRIEDYRRAWAHFEKVFKEKK